MNSGDLISREVLIDEFEWLLSVVNPRQPGNVYFWRKRRDQMKIINPSVELMGKQRTA